jgi:hypothetical protein
VPILLFNVRKCEGQPSPRLSLRALLPDLDGSQAAFARRAALDKSPFRSFAEHLLSLTYTEACSPPKWPSTSAIDAGISSRLSRFLHWMSPPLRSVLILELDRIYAPRPEWGKCVEVSWIIRDELQADVFTNLARTMRFLSARRHQDYLEKQRVNKV